MDSSTERCVKCGRPVARVGRAKRYVHANQFHQRIGHEPVVAQRRLAFGVGTMPGARVIDLRDYDRVSA